MVVDNSGHTLLSQCRPVTCIEVTKDLIFICEGPGLVIFHKDRNEIFCRKVIFPLHKTVLGISSQEINLCIDFENSKDVPCVNNEATYLAARWLNGGLKLACLTDENVLHLWSWGSGNSPQNGHTITCSKVRGVQTSLFSATLTGSTYENLLVFSGTNLSSILVWAPQDLTTNHHFLLEGVKGSILSIKFCSENQILVASTDQRSVFAWKFTSPTDSSFSQFGPDFLNNVTIHLIGELIGHAGRVWQVDIYGQHIVSSGQDANIFLWDTMGNLLKVWSASPSVSVRCCRFDPWEKTVISGAHDGSVYQWRLSAQRYIDKTIKLSDNCGEISSTDYPRQVACFNVNHFIASMNSGKFLIVDTEGNKAEIFSNKNLSCYSIFAVSPDRNHIAIGSKNGNLYFLNTQRVMTGILDSKSSYSSFDTSEQLMHFESKIVSLHWLSTTRLVVSSCNQVYILENSQSGKSSNGTLHQLCKFHINWKEKPGVARAISLVDGQENYLILGDELGSVHLFKFGQEEEHSLFSLPNLHGDYGVCSFKLGHHKNEFYSVGRNSSIINLKVETEPKIHLAIVQVIGSRLHWNSKLISTDKGSYICGFSENDFVIVDGTEDKIAKNIACGGAHRCWDVIFSDIITFIFIRHKQLRVSQFNVDSTTLKSGFYGGKTINTIVTCPFLPNVNSKNFCILTGGEDGVLRMLAIKSTGKEFSDLTTYKVSKFQGHVSSIRTITYHHFEETSTLLVFSGGGRSQIIASLIESKGDNDIKWSKKSTTHLQNKGQKGSNPDMRIMSISKSEIKLDKKVSQFLLLCACSDGFLYLVSFNIDNSKFVHLRTLHTSKSAYGVSHSISSVSVSQTNVISCSNSIGQVVIYLKNSQDSDDSSTIDLDKYPVYKHQTNASAITAMKLISLPSLGDIIVTGSDDGILKMTLVVQVPKADGIDLAFVPVHEDRKHHSSAINSICLCQNRIFAASADQVVSFRRLDGQDEVVIRCGVSDVQAMSVLPNPFSHNSVFVLLGGQGFEILRVNL